MSGLCIVAPADGWLTSLDKVLDPVFADRLLGDGFAIDLLGDRIVAPADALVVSIAKTCHAITLELEGGIQVLIHIGVDTVGLNGDGFNLLVQEGQQVVRGQDLIVFDLDHLVCNAPSLLTPIILLEETAPSLPALQLECQVVAGQHLANFPIELKKAPGEGGAATIANRVEGNYFVDISHGLHARPAANLAKIAKSFEAKVELFVGGKSASARSAVSLMSLGLSEGDKVKVTAAGDGAKQALFAVGSFLGREAKEIAASGKEQHIDLRGSTLTGVSLCAGKVVGRAYRFAVDISCSTETSKGVDIETSDLSDAIKIVSSRLSERIVSASAKQSEIITAHLELLADEELFVRAQEIIAGGEPAGRAYSNVIGEFITKLGDAADPYIRQRAEDLRDIERQVLGALHGADETIPEIPDGVILLTDDLLPSQFVNLPLQSIAGVCLAGGGANSHTAILLQEAGIPSIGVIGEHLRFVDGNTDLVLDADKGELAVAPGIAELEAARATCEQEKRLAAEAKALAGQPAVLDDGMVVQVSANLSGVESARLASEEGAEGCGLLRSEFLFQHRAHAPSEDEQYQDYFAIAEQLNGGLLTIRTLDAGGDKAVPYLTPETVENPALGLRGIRLNLKHKELFATQIRAIARLSADHACRILLPMISGLDELVEAREVIEQAVTDLELNVPVELGVMIETPAAAILADVLADQVDFFSIGTNDLTQYTLAMDRSSVELAPQLDGLHPAVLRSIAMVCKAAAAKDIPVSVCGALGADPIAVPLLVGMGIKHLSVAPKSVAQVKQFVRSVNRVNAEAMVRAALICKTAGEVRKMAAAG